MTADPALITPLVKQKIEKSLIDAYNRGVQEDLRQLYEDAGISNYPVWTFRRPEFGGSLTRGKMGLHPDLGGEITVLTFPEPADERAIYERWDRWILAQKIRYGIVAAPEPAPLAEALPKSKRRGRKSKHSEYYPAIDKFDREAGDDNFEGFAKLVQNFAQENPGRFPHLKQFAQCSLSQLLNSGSDEYGALMDLRTNVRKWSKKVSK